MTLNLPQQKPLGIFFDWDGTLVNSYALLEQTHNHVRESFGRPPLEDGEFKQYFGGPRESIYPALYGEGNMDEARKRFEAYFIQHHTSDALQTLQGAEDMLKALKQMDLILGVVSNKKSEFVNAEIDYLGWRPYFDSVVGSGDAKQDKPAPDPLILGIAKSGLDPKEGCIWYVGDTKVDQKCAKSTQSYFIYIKDEHSQETLSIPQDEGQAIKNCAALVDLLLHYT